MRGLMGGFYKITEWIMRLFVINLLWIVCASPFFYCVLMIFWTPQPSTDVQIVEAYFLQSLVMLAVVAPFTVFPATSAMFAVARKWVMGEEDVPLFKTFFRCYKESYIQSMVGGFLFVLIAVVLMVNYYFYRGQSGVLGILSFLFLSFFFIWFVAVFHFFSIISHFHMKVLQIVKNAFLITIGNPLHSVMIIVSNAFILYISFFRITFLIPFFMGSLIAVVSFWHAYRIFSKYQTRQEKLRKQAGERRIAQSGEQQTDPVSDKASRFTADQANPAIETKRTPDRHTDEQTAKQQEGQSETACKERTSRDDEDVPNQFDLNDGKATHFHKMKWDRKS